MALRHQSLTLSQKGGTAMNQVKTFSHPLFGLLNGQLEEALPKASYCDQVLASPSTFTMTEVAKDCSMTVHQLTQLLIAHAPARHLPLALRPIHALRRLPPSGL